MIPLIDLKRQYKAEKRNLEIAVRKVFASGIYLKGRQLEQFEVELANFLSIKQAIGVKSGTDAITLTLLALDIKNGDKVIVPANACHSLFGIVKSGALPLLVDIDPKTLNIDVNSLKKIQLNPKIKAILFVHTYGNPQGIFEVKKFAEDNNLLLVEDCAQAHGADMDGKMAGTIGMAGCFSFYPTKNLACLSNGGAIVTNSKTLAKKIRFLMKNGERKRFVIEKVGLTSDLDELQSAILRYRLTLLQKYNNSRQKLARLYQGLLDNLPLKFQKNLDGVNHVYHMFVIQTAQREKLRDFLAKKGVSTDTHYPIPLHLQPALKYLVYKRGDFPEAERVCDQVLTLPMYPFLTEKEVHIICSSIHKFFTR